MITLYCSTYCPESQAVKKTLLEEGIDFREVDITSGLTPLKEFMALREKETFFDEAKKDDRVGIPTLLIDGRLYDVEDGLSQDFIRELKSL